MALDIQSTLESLGFNLRDRGDYWQTSAIFRGGDNQTAIQIYKDSGVWKDHVNQTPFMNFEKLVELTVGSSDPSVLENCIKYRDSTSFLNFNPNIYKIKMEKIYDQSILENHLPHLDFYLEKGIRPDVLDQFKCGLCTEGKMYQRLVFPIFNLNNQIHGLSGRYVGPNSSDKPKWKHLGLKSKWIYPHHLSYKYIESSKKVILVESIGDVLNLYSHGYKNILCTFGTSVSPSLISYLSGLDLDEIIISFNNDLKSDNRNPGLEGAIKSFFKLINYFDHEKLLISLPVKNDFGDMSNEDFELWTTKTMQINKDHQVDFILNKYEKFLTSQSKSLSKTFFKFKKSIQ